MTITLEQLNKTIDFMEHQEEYSNGKHYVYKHEYKIACQLFGKDNVEIIHMVKG